MSNDSLGRFIVMGFSGAPLRSFCWCMTDGGALPSYEPSTQIFQPTSFLHTIKPTLKFTVYAKYSSRQRQIVFPPATNLFQEMVRTPKELCAARNPWSIIVNVP